MADRSFDVRSVPGAGQGQQGLVSLWFGVDDSSQGPDFGVGDVPCPVGVGDHGAAGELVGDAKLVLGGGSGQATVVDQPRHTVHVAVELPDVVGVEDHQFRKPFRFAGADGLVLGDQQFPQFRD